MKKSNGVTSKSAIKTAPKNSAKAPAAKKKKVLFAASEAVPFVKTGGLADVCGALPKILRKLGYDVRLVLPRYWAISREYYGLEPVLRTMGVPTGNGVVWCQVFEGKVDGFPVYFVEHEQFFGRAGIYDDGNWEHPDNAERYGFFSCACLQLCRDLKFKPDIIHCHDWQTALIPAYLKVWYGNDPFFKDTASVFSIHNIAYQGTFKATAYPFLGLGSENFVESKFENFGGVNFVKGGIFYADAISTVSPTYAQEILSEPGANGLSAYLNRRRDDLFGILNGADYDHWDPETDVNLPAKYSARDLSGKKLCKKALQQEFLLDEQENVPVIGIVSRLAEQKGFQHLAVVMHRILRDMKVQFAIVGSGEKSLEDFFGGLPALYPGRVGAWIGYSNRKAHLVEAGADFFLMPSLYEPCGLNQIYSLKYGTLPIVRATGGLRDTVRQYDEQTGSGNGFLYHDQTPDAICGTVGWAVSTYYDRQSHLAQMRKRAMLEHFSWLDAAKQYEEVYRRALARRASWR
ncbi:MAG TPA: glycogen synthase GlgA [Candidatus Omnitrophota bacterium]|nr:glycogen synthase GlgA [Candidatus Omnitrophota bacterium]HPS36944.1 glycogen synthase GlgA [Candidatus Omnitrophota bacterium]